MYFVQSQLPSTKSPPDGAVTRQADEAESVPQYTQLTQGLALDEDEEEDEMQSTQVSPTPQSVTVPMMQQRVSE